MKKQIATLKRLLTKHKSLFFLLLAVLVVFVFLKNWLIVALVNGRPITRLSLDRELEKQGGKQVLESKITEILILNEAKKEKVSISPLEIEQKIKEIESQLQGQKLTDLLAMQGQTLKDLEKQIKLQLSIERILSKDISVSDKDISDYFEKNKGSYPKDTKLEDKKAEIKSLLLNQALGQKFQSWLEESKKKAKIYYFLKF